MIGQFRFSERPCDQHVIIRMEWLNGLPSARVEAPGHVSDQLEDMNVVLIGGAMGLEFALSYGVLIAALAKTKLTLSGDMSAWPAEWGDLSRGNVSVRAENSTRAH